jgi:hypothetical protein
MVWICAGTELLASPRQVIALNRLAKGRFAATVNQIRGQLFVVSSERTANWRRFIFVSEGDIGSMIQQSINHFDIPCFRSMAEWCAAVFIHGIDARAHF